jgi:hypothetical protein
MIARSSSVPEEWVTGVAADLKNADKKASTLTECTACVAADPKITQWPELIDANIRKAQ